MSASRGPEQRAGGRNLYCGDVSGSSDLGFSVKRHNSQCICINADQRAADDLGVSQSGEPEAKAVFLLTFWISDDDGACVVVDGDHMVPVGIGEA